MSSEKLFKSIGDVATNIDAQTERQEDGEDGKQQDVAMGFEDENREVQEMESMCMECGKNVSMRSGLKKSHPNAHRSRNCREQHECFLRLSLTSVRSLSCLSDANIAETATRKFSRQAKFNVSVSSV